MATDAAMAAARLDPPRQPLAFEVNRGQTAADVAYLARGPGYILYLTPGEAVLSLKDPAQGAAPDRLLRMGLVGGAAHPAIGGVQPLPGRHNYYIGNDPARWRTGIPTYGEVRYRGVYPGIDMVYHGHQGLLEYDFHVAPGADPGAVRLRFKGADHMKVNGGGDLVLDVGGRQVVHHAPYAYQTMGEGRQTVKARFVIHHGIVAFKLGDYDGSRPLVIDPALNYSSFFGGLGDDDAYGVAVDGSGNKYLTGVTNSTNLPGAINGPNGGNTDAFVTKLDSSGSVVFTTYLGSGGLGSIDPPGGEKGDAIAVDGLGNIYVTGGTAANTGTNPFPSTTGSYSTCKAAAGNVFVVILDNSGNVTYSTCVGGGNFSEGLGLALDSNNAIYVAGTTTSYSTGTAFPTTTGALKRVTGDPSATADQKNGFFFKLDTSASGPNQLVYSTYVGGDGIDEAHGLALDSANHAYITGSTTSSTGFPITVGAYDSTGHVVGNLGNKDAFVLEINPDPNDTPTNNLIYGTYFGGSNDDVGNGIAVDTLGRAYIAGSTISTDLFTSLAYQSSYKGGTNGDAFVAGINPAGNGSTDLIFSTYLGGSGDDAASAVAVDANGRAYVVGTTTSSDIFKIPVLSGTGYGGGSDAFVARFESFYTNLSYAAYLGGSGDDIGRGIALDSITNAYIVGSTASTNFLVKSAPTEFSTNAGGKDAFLSIIGPAADMGIANFSGTSPPPALLEPLTYSINVTNSGPDTATNAVLTITFNNAGLTDPSFGGTNCTSNTTTGIPPTLITCALGTLTSGQLVPVSITGTLTTAASMTATATVTADPLDTNSANDSAAWEVTAGTSSRPPPPPTGGGGTSSGGGVLGPLTLAVLAALGAFSLGGRRGRGASRGTAARR